MMNAQAAADAAGTSTSDAKKRGCAESSLFRYAENGFLRVIGIFNLMLGLTDIVSAKKKKASNEDAFS